MSPSPSIVFVAWTPADSLVTGVFVFSGTLALSLLKTWYEHTTSRSREVAPPAEPSMRPCPSCGSPWTIPVRRKAGSNLDASYFVCTACHKRSGDGVWSDAPAPEELRDDSDGTLSRLLTIKDRVTGPRTHEPAVDVSGLIDEIRRRERRPHRINLRIRDRPPLWDDWLDGGP